MKAENWKIPAEEYEKIITTYFPISVEQLREHCGYDANSNIYAYEMIYASPYPPFGEVVDYRWNDDGTITLIVDGVWADYNSDFAFQNVIVVQPFEDGSFCYLSNFVEEKELELPQLQEWKDDEMKFGKGHEFLMMVLIAGCLLCDCEKRKLGSENMIAGNTKEIKI